MVRKYFPHNTRSGQYLDVGAYHPFKHSNTAFFWLRGWTGVNVDANPKSIELFKRYRASDKNIWAALITELELSQGKKDVSLLLPSTRSGLVEISGIGTVDKSRVSRSSETMEVKVPAKSINQILRENSLKELDLFSLDIEGYDEIVLMDFDFDYCLPKMIVVEDFSESFEALLVSKITTYLAEREYKLVGRAGLSSIFSFRGQSY